MVGGFFYFGYFPFSVFGLLLLVEAVLWVKIVSREAKTSRKMPKLPRKKKKEEESSQPPTLSSDFSALQDNERLLLSLTCLQGFKPAMDRTFQRILILLWLTGSNRGLRASTLRANCKKVFRSLRWSGEARTFSLKCPLQAAALGAPVALLRVPTRAFERKAIACLLHYFLWLRISLLKGRAEAFPYWLGLSTGSGVGWLPPAAASGPTLQ